MKGVEDALHDYEDTCEDYLCNSVAAGYTGTSTCGSLLLLLLL